MRDDDAERVRRRERSTDVDGPVTRCARRPRTPSAAWDVGWHVQLGGCTPASTFIIPPAPPPTSLTHPSIPRIPQSSRNRADVPGPDPRALRAILRPAE